MYVDRMDLIAGLGKSKALEEAIERVGHVRKGVPGFLGHSLLRSYAYPNKYTVVGRWENIESAWAFSASDELASFLKSMPADDGLSRTRFEGYDSVIEVDADPLPPIENARYEQFADWELSSISKAAAYEESRRELFELQKKHNPAFVSARLRRSAGVPTKYLMILIYTDKEGARGGRAQELADFVAAHPASNYSNSSPQIEGYHVIHRM